MTGKKVDEKTIRGTHRSISGHTPYKMTKIEGIFLCFLLNFFEEKEGIFFTFSINFFEENPDAGPLVFK